MFTRCFLQNSKAVPIFIPLQLSNRRRIIHRNFIDYVTMSISYLNYA